MSIPRVHLHEGLGRRLGTVTTPTSVNRSWALMQPQQATFECSRLDPLIDEPDNLDPRVGHAVVIDSDSYRLPWVGVLARVEMASPDTVRCTVASLDTVLRYRYVRGQTAYSGRAGQVFERVLEDSNLLNPSGIQIGSTAGGPAYAASFPDRATYTALNSICRDTGQEWWLNFDPSGARIIATAQIAPARGADRFDVLLSDGQGGNCETLGWAIDVQSALAGITVVAGQVSVLQPYTDRSRTTRRLTDITTQTVHGYEVEHSALGGSDLTRRDALLIAEHLQSVGAIDAASRLRLGQPANAERPIKLRLLEESAELWGACEVGNIVRYRSRDAFLGRGYDGPVRIVAVQPMEEAGDCVLVCQTLRAKGR